MYAYDTILILPSIKDSKGSDKIREGEKKRNRVRRKKNERENLTYDYGRRISTNINIRWHLSLQQITID